MDRRPMRGNHKKIAAQTAKPWHHVLRKHKQVALQKKLGAFAFGGFT
jgi:hypothetical protein